MPLSGGQAFAGYRVIRMLGSGGMGEVYLAQHPRLPRHDALKLLPRDWSGDPEYRARFNQEADLASTLWHPHIVGVHDRGEEDGQLWISMDFVDGMDAARLLADRYPDGMPVGEVARIITAVASALDYAHKQGLLHRDVKPANIMVTHLDDEDEQRILLADFGIARNVDDISGITKTNMTVGTVAYCAPEQLLGEQVDGRADQYSLAATAFHLLTGSQLFPHSNPLVVSNRHLNLAPPSVADGRPELAHLDPILAIGLAKRPEDRFRRCSDFARALTDGSPSRPEGSSNSTTQAAPLSRRSGATGEMNSSRNSRIASRRTWVLASVAALVAVLIGLAVFLVRPLRGSDFPALGVNSPTISAAITPTALAPGSTSVAGTLSSLPASNSITTTLAATQAVPTSTTDQVDEPGFLKAARSLPSYVLPESHNSTDADVLAFGYKACAALDEYPAEQGRATRAIFPSYGQMMYDADMFMLDSATYLCPRHAHLYENY